MKFYKDYNDGDNRYLVPLSDWDTVMNLEAIGDEDTLNDVLDGYDRLEGQSVVLVLEEDIVDVC